jgi:hypothetical protein
LLKLLTHPRHGDGDARGRVALADASTFQRLLKPLGRSPGVARAASATTWPTDARRWLRWALLVLAALEATSAAALVW